VIPPEKYIKKNWSTQAAVAYDEIFGGVTFAADLRELKKLSKEK
jgi:hypothetical protein